MKIKPIKQPDESACGPTSVLMVSNYFKDKLTFEDIAIASQYIKRDGLSDNELVETLVELGYNVRHKDTARWSDLKQANSDNAVVIVSWMLDGYIGHFSVVEEVTDEAVTLAEPQTGKHITFEKIKFMRLWMGYDDVWYPVKNTDITLRWMCVVKKKKTTQA